MDAKFLRGAFSRYGVNRPWEQQPDAFVWLSRSPRHRVPPVCLTLLICGPSWLLGDPSSGRKLLFIAPKTLRLQAVWPRRHGAGRTSGQDKTCPWGGSCEIRSSLMMYKLAGLYIVVSGCSRIRSAHTGSLWDLLPELLIVLIFKRNTWWFHCHTRVSYCFIKLWVWFLGG